jgi:hypothetical protein
MTLQKKLGLGIAVSMALATGCGKAEDLSLLSGPNDELAMIIKAKIAGNGIKKNGIKKNGIKKNGIKKNGTSKNGASINNPSADGLTLIGAMDTGEIITGSGFVGSYLTGLYDNGDEMPIKVVAWSGSKIFGMDAYLVNDVDGDNICGYENDDRSKPIWASPIRGAWDEQDGGERGDDDSIWTFGCQGGALQKCQEWGYPKTATASETLNGVTKSRTVDNLHAACSRLVPADYCGDGLAHTYNGTSIDVYDHLSIQEQTPGLNWPLEAEWRKDGAWCIGHTRWAPATGSNIHWDYILSHCPQRIGNRPNPNGTGLVSCSAADDSFAKSVGFNINQANRIVIKVDSPGYTY